MQSRRTRWLASRRPSARRSSRLCGRRRPCLRHRVSSSWVVGLVAPSRSGSVARVNVPCPVATAEEASLSQLARRCAQGRAAGCRELAGALAGAGAGGTVAKALQAGEATQLTELQTAGPGGDAVLGCTDRRNVPHHNWHNLWGHPCPIRSNYADSRRTWLCPAEPHPYWGFPLRTTA